MIARFLVPIDARPPNPETTRRRPSTLDERTLIPATMPVIPLNGHSNIPASLPLESVAARTVVPRDIRREEFVVEEGTHLPLQPTDLDERITVPLGAAPPEIVEPVVLENIPLDLVDRDIFMTGEVNLLSTPTHGAEQARWDLVKNVSSFSFHILMVLAIIFWPRIFPRRGPTQEQLDLARRQMTILLPPGALDAPKTAPRTRERTSENLRVSPKVLRQVAPPEPQPAPAPKEPERVVKELPSAPMAQPNATPPAPEPAPSPKSDAPKQALKLEKPEEQQTPRALILPKNSPGGSIRDSIRESARMNAPTAMGGGGQLPSGIPGGSSQGTAYGAMEMLTPTQGVDFSNYLQRVYVTVKQNWFAVMPESVRLGDKGVVSLVFKIMKDGSVPGDDPRRVFGSGKEPLDRAAVSSIRASNPFEPLPSAFSGTYIELRFTYYYNLQPDYSH
jgi:outer membrane biosynthesis protein TonB